ncbi:MAG: formate dehydrogenase accessory sulfurtransferase FdhD [Acidimicrobiales bacterium]
MRPPGTTVASVRVIDDGEERGREDVLATEEPLEIRLEGAGTLAVTMRTPGADFELAAGFLYTESVIDGRRSVQRISYCVDGGEQRYNAVTVRLSGPVPDLTSMERYGTVSSACGVCGKASLDALRRRGIEPLPEGEPRVRVETLFTLPDALRSAQRNFAVTGGLHAAGLFTVDGSCLAVREDVGRHNAVDKVIGWALLRDRLPLTDAVLVVSGRAGFEIVQKAAAARIPIVGAVSAPSSLAVDVAKEFGLTLVGFLRGRRTNVYAGRSRLV